eukprot:4921637-Alexandrium_andersonii.AAC.1
MSASLVGSEMCIRDSFLHARNRRRSVAPSVAEPGVDTSGPPTSADSERGTGAFHPAGLLGPAG